MLDNVRRKHIASATAWESLARVLRGKTGNRHDLRLSKLPQTLDSPTVDSGDASPQRPSVLEDWENEGGSLREIGLAGAPPNREEPETHSENAIRQRDA